MGENRILQGEGTNSNMTQTLRKKEKNPLRKNKWKRFLLDAEVSGKLTFERKRQLDKRGGKWSKSTGPFIFLSIPSFSLLLQ